MRILLVEDDITVANGLTLVLRSGGTSVDQAHTGEGALELIGRHDYDIAVIDVMLPDIEGYGVIRSLRNGGNHLPVLIMSGLSSPEARVKGLGAGADDFITKPFDNDELLARLQAILRRSNRSFVQPTLSIGAVHLNTHIRSATVSERPVAITDTEYAILELLFLRKGMLLTKEVILTHIYHGRDEPAIKIIDVFICNLRKKLADAGAARNLIRTVWGQGYTVSEPSKAPGAIESDQVLDLAVPAF